MSCTRRRTLLAGLAAPGLLGAWVAQPELPLVLSTDPNQPYGRVTLQIIDAIGQGAQRLLRWQVVPWARALRMAEAGEALAWGVSHTPERAQRLAFSQPVYENKVWIVERTGSPTAASGLTGLAGLRGQRICLRRGEHYDAGFEAAREREFEVQLSDGELPGRLRMVQNGRCDLTLVSRRYARAALLRALQLLPGGAEGLDVRPLPLLHEGVHIVTAKGSALAEHLPALNQGIRAQARAIQALIDAE